MASSTVIGLLRVLLSMNSAEFESALQRTRSGAKAWAKDLNTIGRQAQTLGANLTKTLTLPIAGAGAAMAKAAINFESSFAGVRKTVDATESQFADMAQGFRNLAKQIPVSVDELNRLGEAAGALGIPTQQVVGFAKVMAMLGVTTNLTSDQAAEGIAKIQNVFGAAGKDTDRFGAALVALGKDGASTESQILDMATRIAGAGHVIGITQPQVLAIASALSSVGIEAEAGGTAISRVMVDLANAVANGGSKLEGFAKVAGMTGAQFAQAFKTDAAGALVSFIEGLGRVKEQGGNTFKVLEDLGQGNIRVRTALLNAAGAGDLMRRALELGSKAWQDNTALTETASARFGTTEARLTVLWNRIKDVGITLGNALLPVINDTIGVLEQLIPIIDTAAHIFTNLPKPLQAVAVGMAAAAAAAGPLLYAFGQVTLSAGAIVGAFGPGGLATRALTGGLVPALKYAGIGALAFGAAVGGWKVGEWIAKLKLFENASMTIGESFEFGATKLFNWVRGVKASDADIEAAITSRRHFNQTITDTSTATQDATRTWAQLTQGLRSSVPALEQTGSALTTVKTQTKELIPVSRDLSQVFGVTLPAAVHGAVPGILAYRDALASLGNVIEGIPAGSQIGEDVGSPQAPKVSLFKSIFGSSADFGKELASTIMGAIQGGGDAVAAAGSLIGTKITTHIAQALTGGAGIAIKGALGGAINAILPGLGSLLGPLASSIGHFFSGLFDRNKGRDLVVQFADSLGGFDALQRKLEELGDEGARLWVQLTQGVGRNNPDQAKAAIEAVTQALARHEEQVRADAEAQRQAQQQVVDNAKQAVSDLDAKIKSLQDSIADEAPEKVMGTIEKRTRAHIAALEKERAAAQKNVDDLMASFAKSADRIADALEGIPRDIDIKIRTRYDESSIEKGGITGGRGHFAHGGIVPQYLAGGGLASVLGFTPKGSDTVPIMASPGELLLNMGQQQTLAGAMAAGMSALHHLDARPSIVSPAMAAAGHAAAAASGGVDLSALDGRLRALERTVRMDLPAALAKSIVTQFAKSGRAVA